MIAYIQTGSLFIAGILLLWFGYTLFFRRRPAGPARPLAGPEKPPPAPPSPPPPSGPPRRSGAEATQFCPVCSALLREGEQVSSSAFPSFNGQDRFMHIKGCAYCLSGERERVCPVCKERLKPNEILISKLYERPFNRSHVHVLGCSRCQKIG